MFNNSTDLLGPLRQILYDVAPLGKQNQHLNLLGPLRQICRALGPTGTVATDFYLGYWIYWDHLEK